MLKTVGGALKAPLVWSGDWTFHWKTPGAWVVRMMLPVYCQPCGKIMR
jgi:hypothetical protein